MMHTPESELHQHYVAFKVSHNTLLALLAIYPPELFDQKDTAETATPRQTLMQMAGWLREAGRRFARFQRGTGEMKYNDAVFNRVSLRQREGHSWEELIAEIESLSGEINAQVKDLVPQRMAQEERYIAWLKRLTDDCDTRTQHLYQLARDIPDQNQQRARIVEQEIVEQEIVEQEEE